MIAWGFYGTLLNIDKGLKLLNCNIYTIEDNGFTYPQHHDLLQLDEECNLCVCMSATCSPCPALDVDSRDGVPYVGTLAGPIIENRSGVEIYIPNHGHVERFTIVARADRI